MTQAVATAATDNAVASRIEEVVILGNLGSLTSNERVIYYRELCDAIGIDWKVQPFSYLTLNGKLVLYANRACAEQLRATRGISISEPQIQYLDDMVMVTVTATDKTGRTDSDIGVVPLGRKTGEDRANSLMKAITKAKRRVTLSISGLGMLDETEVDSIPDSAKKPAVQMPRAINPAPPAVDVETGEIRPGIWDAFWEKTRALGFTEGQVRDFSGMQADQFDALNREALQLLLNDLKVATQPTQPALG